MSTIKVIGGDFRLGTARICDFGLQICPSFSFFPKTVRYGDVERIASRLIGRRRGGDLYEAMLYLHDGRSLHLKLDGLDCSHIELAVSSNQEWERQTG